MKIKINHIGKMEGHSDFVAEIMKGDVRSAKMMTTEGSRLIEGILCGRAFYEAPIITSRICGICPVVHKLASVKAIENAFNIKPSEQTIKLRKLMNLGQIIHSHALHLFFLSLPDFLGLEDEMKFIKEYSKETNCAIAVRGWGLKIIEVIGGRAVHPIACEVGGFKVLPKKEELDDLHSQYEKAMKDALCLVKIMTKINFPKFERKTTFMGLENKDEYGLYGGDIAILDENGVRRTIGAEKFTKNVKEIEEPYRAAKSATLDGSPFMVGALARINLNSDQLNPMARGVLKSLKWKLPNYNSFHNIIAQTIEVIHCIEEAEKLLNDLRRTLREEKSTEKKMKAIAKANPLNKTTIGVDAVEAPRGTLYHYYKINKDGYIESCNIIPPTNSFLKNLEQDVKAYLPNVLNMPEEKRKRKIRALIRAYDPCIACATH